jgi:hypothetical protein
MRHDVEDGGDRVIEDGESVRCPIFLKDHRPRFLRASDAEVRDAQRMARDARQTWIRGLQDSWRMPSRDAAMPDLDSRPEELMRDRADPAAAANAVERRLEVERGADPAADLERDRRRIHAQFSQRLQNAWRHV